MDWKDNDGIPLKIGDLVLVDDRLHEIKLAKIRSRNRVVFVPVYTPNILTEYCYRTYKQVKKFKLKKYINENL